jgi:hypothetical protein
MHRGRLTGEFSGPEFPIEHIGAAITGVLQ